MSLWVTWGVMRRSLHLVQHCTSRVIVSGKNSCSSIQLLADSTRQIRPRRVTSLTSSVRFHSRHYTLGPEKVVSTSVTGSLVLDENQHPSGQRQRRFPFSELLQQCGSPSDVLDLSQQFAPNPGQISNYLTRSMQNENLAYSLLAMVNLGVPQRSRVVQLYLRACQEKLNDFDEKSLSILASCLEKMESTPNVDALKHGFRLVVEQHLPRIKNVLTLQTMMRALGKDIPHDLQQKLERKALSMTEQFTLPNTQYMISTMAKMGFYSKPLLDICSRRITENLHGVPFSKLTAVLLSCRELHYRNVNLLTGISDYVASTLDIWSQKEIVLMLCMFERLAFSPTALLAEFAQRVVANPDALTLKDLLCVLKVYSSLNYCPQHDREPFLQSLSKTLDFYLPRMCSYDLLKACYCLCLLGHFPSAPLEKLLQSTTLEDLSSRESKHLRKQERMFQTVHLCLHLDRPVLPQPLSVPATMLGEATSSSTRPVSQHLSQLLQRVLSTQADVEIQEMAVVEDFYFIDGVISKPGENQTSSEETQTHRMAVLCPAPSAFCFGTSEPRGPLAVKLRHLKILGYIPNVITERELKSEEKAGKTISI
ncbi:FAST kinase domain-containing protein 2, mitochondrial isoform X2 [Festucalex cinctus]